MRYKMNKAYIKRNNVIHQSAKLFYYKGYKNTSVTDILKECKIPKGSFYYYFKSKNDLLMTVIDHHTDNLINFFNITVNDLSILKLKIFFKEFFNNIELNKFHGGSPIGNLAIELSDINDEARNKLVESYKKIEKVFYGAAVSFSFYFEHCTLQKRNKNSRIQFRFHFRIFF